MHHARETRHVEISSDRETHRKSRPYKYDIASAGCRNIEARLTSADPKAVSKRKGCTRMRLPVLAHPEECTRLNESQLCMLTAGKGEKQNRQSGEE